MHRLFQIIRACIVGFVFISSIAVAHATPKNKDVNNSIQSLDISWVSFGITTIVGIRCDEFTSNFAGMIKTFFVYDKIDIAKFEKIFNELKPGLDLHPDTRARVLIHYQNGHIDKLCVAGTGVSLLNGKTMRPSREMVRFIESIRIREAEKRESNQTFP